MLYRPIILSCALFATSAYAEVIQYQYDDSNKLIKAEYTTDFAVDYSYDAMGNMLAISAGDSSGNQAPILSSSDISDPSGNPVNSASIDPIVGLKVSWDGVDQDVGDLIYYDLYLSTDGEPTLYVSGLTSSEFVLDDLDPDKTYFWKVVVRDQYNESTESVISTFTTTNALPSSFSNILPANGAYKNYNSVDFFWEESTDLNQQDEVVYDFYIGISSDPELFLQGLTINKLIGVQLPNVESTQYWRVVARDNHGGETSSQTWVIHPKDTDGDGIVNAIEAGRCTSASSSDTDNDGISDNEEDFNANGIVDSYETDPCNKDTDFDAMPDGWESQNQLDPLINDSEQDYDLDGITNIYEYVGGSNPASDASIPAEEFIYTGFESGAFDKLFWIHSGKKWFVDDENPSTGLMSAGSGYVEERYASSNIETIVNTPESSMYFYVATTISAYNELQFYIDGELKDTWSGATQYQRVEYPVTAGVHSFKWVYYCDSLPSGYGGKGFIDDLYIPGLIDEDNDGVKDSWEYYFFSNITHDLSQDTDGDGLTDYEEYVLELIPTNEDQDADGMIDGWEVEFGLDPLIDDSRLDTDGDTYTNYVEFIRDSDPSNESSIPSVATRTSFEDGKFDIWYWKMSGEAPWSIVDTNPKNGVFSAKSGKIDTRYNESITEIKTKTLDGEISFDVSVINPVSHYNRLNFYIDGVYKGDWTSDIWNSVSFPVTAGLHTFKWSFIRGGGADNDDAVYIDNIDIPTEIHDEDNDGVNDSWEYGNFSDLAHDYSGDTDTDGLTDIQESVVLSNPFNMDTDHDLMPDKWEFVNNLELTNNDAFDDVDGDLTCNYIEYSYGTDPQVANGQSMPLGFESGKFDIWYWARTGDSSWVVDGSNPNTGSFSAGSGLVDKYNESILETKVKTTDGVVSFYIATDTGHYDNKLYFSVDGSTRRTLYQVNAYQKIEIPVKAGVHKFNWTYYRRTNGAADGRVWIDDVFIPAIADEDADGILDSWEYYYFNKITTNLAGDTDGDGLSDFEEGLLQSNPKNVDTDDDQMPDFWEAENNLDISNNDASDDKDGDGVSNYQEYLNGTDPNDGTSL